MAVRTAFNALVLEKGYVDLTMGELAQAANIGRSTLYEHFRTKDDVLRMSLEGPFATLAALVLQDARADTLVPLLEHFRSQRVLARVLFASPAQSVLTECLTALIETHLDGVYRGRQSLPNDLIARAIACAQLALIEHWLARRASLTAPVVADALIRSSRGLIDAPRDFSGVDAGVERGVG